MKPLYIAKLLPVFLLIFSGQSFSSEYAYLGGYSTHWGKHPNSTEANLPDGPCWDPGGPCVEGLRYYDPDFNGNHKLIGYEKNGFMIAHFKNSFYQNTWMIDKKFDLKKYGDFTLLGSIGLTYGYKDCDFENRGSKSEVCPSLQIGIAYTKYKIEPVVSTGGDYISLVFRIRI